METSLIVMNHDANSLLGLFSSLSRRKMKNFSRKAVKYLEEARYKIPNHSSILDSLSQFIQAV